ncbi:glycerol uptake operon antiterminator regulatory protein [Staphylococcus aureus]|nr:glycerol uptake operon antiterminator regulatory protein [Staphylococcus aureus MISS6017]CAI2994731.1 hypothetical protein HPCNMFEM_HPCNMFEM_01130 [Staphylococcus aureus]SRC05878.1 glycerol uptake operon antiterminator regulatory protein [Staphylococcus aureus]SRC13647.1 glycerol uptake operon antiterminator regulatory protein [Staphylococcus aureus]SRC76774.1 glycerol uptake operon antiterminator regulatory protein [Staphylococcus aureus]
MNNNILPAIRNIKDLEKLIKTDYKMCVLLDMHIGHIKSIMELLKQNHIECFIHIDLIKGLSHDEFASEFIIQQYKPKGIVSTKSKVIKKAKSLNTLTIFRVFIIDSQALKRSIDLIKKLNLILLKYFQVLRVKRFIIFRKKQTHKSLQVA